jgi:hypothetical protein
MISNRFIIKIDLEMNLIIFILYVGSFFYNPDISFKSLI